MIETYKIISGKYDTSVNFHLELSDSVARGNKRQLKKERCRTKRRQMFFRLRITDIWNRLPNEVVEAISAQSFEKRLDNFWDKQ